MRVYLAGFKTIEKIWNISTDDIYLLSSFFEHKTGTFGNYVYQKNHILDSGAFSFFDGTKTMDWTKYTNAYCDFINKTKQDLFFELDIDLITSLSFAEDLRKRIEDKTGKKPIPVWRPSRGIDYWYKMCEDYDYVAISASGKFDSAWTRKTNAEIILNKMCIEAHKRNSKVHGLGFTTLKPLQNICFDSIDSTTWNVGGKYGNVCLFNKNYTHCRQKKPQNVRVKNINALHLHNFKEWVKFQKYADKNL